MGQVLGKAHEAVTAALDAGRIPGAIVLAASDGRVVHHDARGVLDADSGFVLTERSILWLASLSKPVCAVAVLALAEDGALNLDDPVSRFIPEFAALGRVRVLRPGSPVPPPSPPFGPPPDPLPEYDEVPAEREIVLRDLLTHTGGLQSIHQWNPEYERPVHGATLASYVPKLAGVVRDFQPGTTWAYSNAAGFDILARVVEVASDRRYDEFLADRVLGPLRVSAFGFGYAGRPDAMPVAAPLTADPVVMGDGYYSAAAGMWGRPADYLAFATMLGRGGVAQDGRVVSEASVAEMSRNQVGDLCPGLTGRPSAPGVGFGLAVAVVDEATAANVGLPAGTFGWDGMGTRRFWVCPAEGWQLFMYVPDQEVQADVEAAVAAALG
jgi:CubicO group peptidase (beta-lactamase class C family)